ncbi:MAG TPA: acyl-CoA dehydrogenase [Rhizomicrobium sp.]|nr:acyl-CoA dehydrogenase [Rhizomicrobium sp.]
MADSSFRRDRISKPIFKWAKTALPELSATEREAIEAGDVWWDGDLFTGKPDWDKLLDTPQAVLTDEEQAFLDGPVNELCAMVDDWQVNWELHDLPEAAWDFLKAKKFFAMIIPKEYGGLGFSPFAHSEVVRKISTRSSTAAVTAMVPNSLGPGELLMQFGTKDQRDYWLPRLADGREIPCFGLTSPEAGSDAASMVDTGVVCKGTWKGEEVLGIKLNWHKRYITLAPVATVLGLAFKLYDPDRLLGGESERGITLALVPTDLPGVSIGRRHLPALQMFQNGPNWGKDVFIPMDHVIGGTEYAGKGWRMLMSALATGRGISLPSLSAAGAAFCAHVTGAYARVRQQFNIPIGEFEAIQERLARIAGIAYQLDAARRLTCAALNQGHHPAVISAIMKAQATERLRIAVDDAMDVHAGKAVIEGPLNYMGSLYRAVPVGITVEGANILTRALIVFGQGAIRSHPYLLDEIAALNEKDPGKGLTQFDKLFWRHAGNTFVNMVRAKTFAWTGSLFAPAPRRAGRAARYYRQLGRYTAAFSVMADLALLIMGGALKRKEMLSMRFGDVLSELYLLSAVLKRWEDEGRQDADFPLLAYCMESGFATMAERLDHILANFPNRPVAWLLRAGLFPFGRPHKGPSDALMERTARILLEPSSTRERLTAGLYHGRDDEAVGLLNHAFALTTAAGPLVARLRKEHCHDWQEGVDKGVITADEGNQIAAALKAAEPVIAVDDFAPEKLSPQTETDPARAVRDAAQ